jgi:hypothetical protein
MNELRLALKIPLGIPTPKLLLKIGAKLIGTETELVLKSRNVIPERLQKSGFEFHYESVEKTFKTLLFKKH